MAVPGLMESGDAKDRDDAKGHGCAQCDINMEKQIIHVDCASHRYPDGCMGIHDMCFNVGEREIVAVCGSNGSGKSTLLEHLNGLLLPTSGQVYIMGKPYLEVRREIWKHVGLVFQKPDDQLFAPTVLDDVMFGPINLGMDEPEARKAAMKALRDVGAEDFAGKIPDYLSGGQKRLVAIAGILAMKPRVMAMDEPTSALDDLHGVRIELLIREMRDVHGISVVVATHDVDMASRLADRVCILVSGSVVASGRPGDIFYDTELLQKACLSPPKIVCLYREYCERKRIPPDQRPLTVEELLDIIV